MAAAQATGQATPPLAQWSIEWSVKHCPATQHPEMQVDGPHVPDPPLPSAPSEPPSRDPGSVGEVAADASRFVHSLTVVRGSSTQTLAPGSSSAVAHPIVDSNIEKRPAANGRN